jgi:hypothetical protein
MADKRTTVDARKLLEAQKATLLEQAKQVERDLEDLDRITEKYGLEFIQVEGASSKSPKATNPPAKPPSNGAGPVSVVVRKVATEHFRRTGTRATSSTIQKVLATKGVSVKVKRVSSYLTRSDLFDNEPEHGGYGLAEWNGAPTANDAKGLKD